jgi:hypothetical protein
MLLVASISIIALVAFATLYVLSFEPVQIEIEVRLLVVSQDTALWDPGFHLFTMEGEGHLLAPLDTTFTISGNGSADYTMTEGYGPPGPFEVDVQYQGHIPEHPFLGGPIALDGRYTGHTLELLTRPGYLRTEDLLIYYAYAWLEAYWDPTPFNLTDGAFTVNFISIGDGGKSFEIDVNGTATVFRAEEPEPVPEFPVILSFVTAAVLTAWGLRRATRTPRH